MINAKDDIRADRLTNIGHTLSLIREAKEVSGSLNGIGFRRVARVTESLIRDLEKQVKEAGFALVTFQGRQGQPPEVMPVVDGEPTPVLKLEQMVEKGRFPRDEFDRIKVKHGEIKTEIDSIFLQIRALQKEIQEKNRQADKLMFSSLAGELIAPLRRDFNCAELDGYFQHMIDDMVDNIAIFFNHHPKRIFVVVDLIGVMLIRQKRLLR